jgi:sugar/nucleoside kinase (ribokinase family)
MIDIVAELPGPLAMGSDVHAPIRYVPGGSAGNTAAWLAAIGADVGLIARIGDDAIGAQARQGLATAGIVDRLRTDPARPSGTCIVLVTPGGERTMVPDPGANAGLVPDDLDRDDFSAGRHLHVSGYALLGNARPAALAALDLARQVGMTISIDAASAAPLALVGGAQFLSWIATGVLLFANAAEADVLTGCGDPFQAARMLSDQLDAAVVKAGADGAYWSSGAGRNAYAPSVDVVPIDTTGAGDAFAAAFLWARAGGAEPEQALRAGHRLAAIACRQVGGRPPPDLISSTTDHRT